MVNLCDAIVGSVTSSKTFTTKQTSAALVTDALRMHLNVVKAITESSAVSLGFWRKTSGMDIYRPRRLYLDQIRAMYCIKGYAEQNVCV